MTGPTRRRLFQAGSVLALGALAGCSGVSENVPGKDLPAVDRLVFRSDTGQSEHVIVYKVFSGPQSSPTISRAGYDAPESGESKVVGVSMEPGFFSVYGRAQNHDSYEVEAFNSYDDDEPATDVQIEFVVRRNGSLWSNINESGADIAIPGRNR